ncbi:MAG TPA: hypothetical protein VFR27_10565 [Mycobacterium sp.]|nr:hypothetical protein [Mycobacterium sp.]
MIRESTRRWNIGRDTIAGVFLAAALVLPWNLYFGVGVPGSRPTVFAALAAATVLSLISIALTYLGRWRHSGAHFGPVLSRLRLALSVPYLLLVLGFVLFDVVQTARYGGSAHVPGGVGPGGWLGIAGALLAAQPVITGGADDRFAKFVRSARLLAHASIVGAGLSVLFNLFWRIRYAVAGTGAAAGVGKQQIAIIATALVYGLVAWVAVVVASRWILQPDRAPAIATTLLAASTLVAGALVWILPVGRYIDGFHGIAQNTSTAGVGFEGFLVWAAAAATIAAPTLHRSPITRPAGAAAWLAANRKLLLLIIIWGVGSALMRGTDLIVAVVLDLPYSPYDSAAMAAFDLVTAVIAVWLRVNLTNRSLPSAALWSVCAVLFGFAIARVVVGVGLAPRLPAPQRAAALANPVYGNGFAQQITSTFDVVLCGLALCSLAIAIVVTRIPAHRPVKPSSPRIFRRAPVDGPKILRAEADPAQHGRHEA